MEDLWERSGANYSQQLEWTLWGWGWSTKAVWLLDPITHHWPGATSRSSEQGIDMVRPELGDIPLVLSGGWGSGRTGRGQWGDETWEWGWTEKIWELLPKEETLGCGGWLIVGLGTGREGRPSGLWPVCYFTPPSLTYESRCYQEPPHISQIW